MHNERQQKLNTWIHANFRVKSELAPISNDASFRKYYRFNSNNKSFIAVDSPPDKENNEAFIGVQEILVNNNVKVPNIILADINNGFMALEDFGDNTLLPLLKKSENPEDLYQLSLLELLKIQACDKDYVKNFRYCLPEFDAKKLRIEVELFREWFASKYLGLELTEQQNNLLDSVYEQMVTNALEQPQTLVHRDFHSRNLLYLDSHQIGVIDFQDAVWGPTTYDLVSLFRDCYISWPLESVRLWVELFYQQAISHNLLTSDIDFNQYWHWFMKMTLQRNFKTIGIFARLYLRDNKPVYLGDIPRTLNYALEVAHYLANDKQFSSQQDRELYSKLFDFFNTVILEKLTRLPKLSEAN